VGHAAAGKGQGTEACKIVNPPRRLPHRLGGFSTEAMEKKMMIATCVSSVLTPDHPRWSEFFCRLTGPEGCNFRTYPKARGGETWNCDHTLAKSAVILASMEDVDVERTLDFFQEYGGYCDCEVVLNVENCYAARH